MSIQEYINQTPVVKTHKSVGGTEVCYVKIWMNKVFTEKTIRLLDTVSKQTVCKN